ncbi:hypothetical protein CGLO_00002 [Colletotrichum gloeosporioides Cg-14]|uniref:Uncharacterized protein n=1 Tax=Colletotrichum gloeosporioides (strain Cg-14) TaxID=1237896 RepID=T0M8A3_COLGC|nr:hypothetical protein CGLO_00002 [Colletotrichum gloeosporioides Cg-14]
MLISSFYYKLTINAY